jgi:metal-responsive CopG/Arc/MetJ family transcriptional regulator
MRITLPDALTTALDRWIERNGYPMSRERALIQLARRGLETINGR